MSGRKAVHLWIAGRVQGVGYRNWLVHEATRRGLSGWTRNRGDGAVEAVLGGEAASVDAVIAACRSGPPAARVDDVTVNEAPEPEPGFRQLPTL